MPLHLYSFFHLNLEYSAIEEKDRPKVIEQCYWPLLRLSENHSIPLGIETSGQTLRKIAEIDFSWISKFRSLIEEGVCEHIGSGYSQIIGPLVSPEVVEKNLKLGHQVYEELLGAKPVIALVNEQAFSSGVIPAYRSEGYSAVIMEWNNPASANPGWSKEMSFLPQRALDPAGDSLPLIWNRSITFQKVQRYVHRELELQELLGYVSGQISITDRALSFYGNDAEIFDFRPGRYMTEAPLPEESEWSRLEVLFSALQANVDISLIRPSDALDFLDRPSAGNLLRLETVDQPIPVKKQNKYNILRWAVTGRNDLDINTRCERLTQTLINENAPDEEWRELCYLWSSDFRTHITESRWEKYLERLARFEARWPFKGESKLSCANLTPDQLIDIAQSPRIGTAEITRQGRILDIFGERLKVQFNCQRGLALESFYDCQVSSKSLCGTLHHGFFDDIQLGADYYSGHLVFESPGHHKFTDLSPIEPLISEIDGKIKISMQVKTSLGTLEKSWFIDDQQGKVSLCTEFHSRDPILGSLRVGHITLNPEAFDASDLFYQSNNGGRDIEQFQIGNQNFDHGRSVSFLISANQAIGATNGVVEFGDKGKVLRIKFDRSKAALAGLVTHQKSKRSHFTRLALSAREVDDTSHKSSLSLHLDLEISARAFKI